MADKLIASTQTLLGQQQQLLRVGDSEEIAYSQLGCEHNDCAVYTLTEFSTGDKQETVSSKKLGTNVSKIVTYACMCEVSVLSAQPRLEDGYSLKREPNKEETPVLKAMLLLRSVLKTFQEKRMSNVAAHPIKLPQFPLCADGSSGRKKV
ncbi:hypothetical protein RRG08_021126 [Elysia crispata]|uniref:Uncharacterized protein n=1 Tax=Elysia crispata TaxID=231223 RepID=A0AAE1DBG0_9GAST|nr:hypothetical protein RRG08_021126 [Elysia crispata]